MQTSLSTVKVLQSNDGTSIYAEATGDLHKPHVVLLAGLSMTSCVFNDMCADMRLRESLYIVRYDVRGHGRSGKPTTAQAYESKSFADDFKTVMEAFGLNKPILAGWSTGTAVATDVVAHLPPATLSGILYLAGMPVMGELGVAMAAPDVVAVVPDLLSNDVSASHKARIIFTDKIFAQPDVVPYRTKCMYLGQTLTPDVMALSFSRPMDPEKLWMAGKEGLALLIVQGTADEFRVGGSKSVEDVMKPNFKNYEAIWLEGRGHALHYECQKEIIEILLNVAKRVGGKDYRNL